MERITFDSKGQQIAGFLRETDPPRSSAVVFCHGAFEFQDHWFVYAQRLNSQGFTTFTFDFAGHGESQGVRSLINLRTWAYNRRDGLNALHARGYQEFALVGLDSGGSAALLAAAHDRRLACAVILSAPVSLVPSFPDRMAFGLVSIAGKIKNQSQKIYSLLKSEKDFQLIEGCGHAAHLDREKERVYQMISKWIKRWT